MNPTQASPGPGPEVQVSTASRETAGEFAGHTPGPWTLGGWNDLVVNAPNGTITLCPGGSYLATLPELKANARIIAAAPALLAERDALRAQLDTATDALRQRTEQRDAALAACKATLDWMEFTIPRLKGKCPHCGNRVDYGGGLNYGGPLAKARAALAVAK